MSIRILPALTLFRNAAFLIIAIFLAFSATARAQGTLYVANTGGSTIDAISSTGSISTFATNFGYVDFLAKDSSGNIYVSLASDNNIQKYSPTGANLGTYGSGFNVPQGLAFDSSSDLFVVNSGTDSVLKVTAGGTTSTFVSGFGFPVGIAVNSLGNVFVGDFDNNTIDVYSQTGTLLETINSGLSGPGQLAFDSAGNLFVANQNGFTVEKYAAVSGGLVSTTGSQFADTGLNSQPTGLAFDQSDNLYVSYAYQSTSLIEKFDTLGNGTVFASGGNLSQPAGLLFVASVPEPATGALLALGLILFALLRFGYLKRLQN